MLAFYKQNTTLLLNTFANIEQHTTMMTEFPKLNIMLLECKMQPGIDHTKEKDIKKCQKEDFLVRIPMPN